MNCVSCEQLRHYTYTGPVRSPLADLDDADICPWCISDGTAASRFRAEFIDVSWNVPDDIPATTKFEVAHRTPGYLAWQDSQWLHHCADAAAFLGLVGYPELPFQVPGLRASTSPTGTPTDIRPQSTVRWNHLLGQPVSAERSFWYAAAQVTEAGPGFLYTHHVG
nr:CbrC family protein [Mycobacterium haemophilum]